MKITFGSGFHVDVNLTHTDPRGVGLQVPHITFRLNIKRDVQRPTGPSSQHAMDSHPAHHWAKELPKYGMNNHLLSNTTKL